MVGLPYIGSGVLGSALGMDKEKMKKDNAENNNQQRKNYPYEDNGKDRLGSDTNFTQRRKRQDEEFGNENIEREDLYKEYNSPNGERNRNYDSSMSINNVDRNDNLELSIDFEELVHSEEKNNERNKNKSTANPQKKNQNTSTNKNQKKK